MALLVLVGAAGSFLYLFYLDVHDTRLEIDWRVHLYIFNAITGQNVTIPAGIGVAGANLWYNHTWDAWGPPGYAPLSTRDNTGTIYIQSVAPQVFVLGNFFDIWGQVLNQTCVGFGTGSYCGGNGNPDPFLSNGSSEYCLQWYTPLDNGKTWIIVFGRPSPEPPTCYG